MAGRWSGGCLGMCSGSIRGRHWRSWVARDQNSMGRVGSNRMPSYDVISVGCPRRLFHPQVVDTLTRNRVAMKHPVLLPTVVALVLLCGTSGESAEPNGTVKVPKALTVLKANLATLESRVVGRPDPPLPFTVEAVYPKLSLKNPMIVMLQPGSTRLLFIDEGGKRLCRTGDDPATGKFDVLYKAEGIQYSFCTHPKFLQNGRIYLGGDRASKTPSGKECTVTELTLDPAKGFALVEGSKRMIITWDSNGHNGAALGFGHDGMLYITSGDGTSDSDTNVTGQRMDLLLSKVLRIDVDHPDKGKTYSVPRDNPFIGTKGVRPETWAFGLRNPWRLSVDPLTGDIWVGNNGQDLWEQIYREEGRQLWMECLRGLTRLLSSAKTGPGSACEADVRASTLGSPLDDRRRRIHRQSISGASRGLHLR